MKTIGVDLAWELTRSCSRLARCLRIERRDGQVFGFTTNAKPLVIDALTYLPAYSVTPTDIASGSNLDTDDLQADGLLDSGTITEDEVRAGRWDYAYFEAFQVNWADLTQGKKKDRAGHMGRVTVGAQTFQAELLGILEGLQIGIGKKTQPACRVSLGSPECGVTASIWGGTVVTADDDFFTFHDNLRTEADGFFDEGVVTFHHPSGDLPYEVKAYLYGLWVTKTQVAYDMTGVAYDMSRGCTRTLTSCASFSNVVNFRGEPWLRGNDALVQIGRHT